MSCSHCPAAADLGLIPGDGDTVLCRVTARETERLDQMLFGSGYGQLVTERENPSTLHGFCKGDALPQTTQDPDVEPSAHYTYCPTWRAEKQRIWKGLETIEAPRKRGSVLPIDPRTGEPFEVPHAPAEDALRAPVTDVMGMRGADED